MDNEISIHILTERVALQNTDALYLGSSQIEEANQPSFEPLQILNFLDS